MDFGGRKHPRTAACHHPGVRPPLLGTASCLWEVTGIGSFPLLRGKNKDLLVMAGPEGRLSFRAAPCYLSLKDGGTSHLMESLVRAESGTWTCGLQSPCFLGTAQKPGKGAWPLIRTKAALCPFPCDPPSHRCPCGSRHSAGPCTGALSAKEARPLHTLSCRKQLTFQGRPGRCSLSPGAEMWAQALREWVPSAAGGKIWPLCCWTPRPVRSRLNFFDALVLRGSGGPEAMEHSCSDPIPLSRAP